MSYLVERRQEEKDRRRNEIIDAAEALYREVGWDAVTMDAVARELGTTLQTVYGWCKQNGVEKRVVWVIATEDDTRPVPAVEEQAS